MPRPKRLEPLSLKWCDVKDKRGITWQVFIQSAPLYLEGNRCLGITFPAVHRIILDGEMDSKMLKQVLVHELLHLACADEYKRNSRAKHIQSLTYDAEELAVRSMEETLTHILPQFGFTFPPLPPLGYLRKLRKAFKRCL